MSMAWAAMCDSGRYDTRRSRPPGAFPKRTNSAKDATTQVTLSWLIMTALGRPVVPEVYISVQQWPLSCAATRAASGPPSAGADARKASQASTGADGPKALKSDPASPQTTQALSPGSAPATLRTLSSWPLPSTTTSAARECSRTYWTASGPFVE